MNKILLSVCILLQSLHLFAQDKPIDNTLLWKISGKNLPKSSFLFGTVHLQDQRLFNFSDSLYAFIKAADGFALEVHPDSLVNAFSQEEDDSLSYVLLRQHFSKSEFRQLSRRLKKELGIDADSLTVKDLNLLKDRLYKPERKPDDMPTFVDAYLFGIARNQGKRIAGLENAADHVAVAADVKNDFNINELFAGLKKGKEITEKLVQFYINEDLRALQKALHDMPADTENKLLSTRNEVMVLRMDSLMQSGSYVVAVGAAHLPGKKGIIELLRSKGYTVQPVFTTTRTHANNYPIKAEQKITWTEVHEPQQGYSIRMPGTPTAVEMQNGRKMNMFMDLTGMKVYYSAFMVPDAGISKQSADSVLEGMTSNVIANAKSEIISSKRFSKDGFEGIDFVSKKISDGTFSRVQILAMDRRVYMVGFTSSQQAELSAPDAETYFNSLSIADMPDDNWTVQTFKDHSFSITFPEEATISKMSTGDSSLRAVQYKSGDSHGSYFAVAVTVTNPGYIIPDDSAYFALSLQRLQATTEMDELHLADTTFEGFNAKRITARAKDDWMVNCLLIFRGNRVYNIIAVTKADYADNRNVKGFFRSFTFLDYPKPAWTSKQFDEYGFTAPVPGSFSSVQYLDENTDSAAGVRQYQWVVYDTASVTTYYVVHQHISPYLWVKHDSILLKKYMNDMVEPGQTILDYRFVRNGSSNGIEFNLKKRNSSLVRRIRLLLNGRSIYTLTADVPGQYWKVHDYSRFMEDIRFTREEKPDFLYSNSLQQFAQKLASTDSATHIEAYNAIDDLVFDPAEYPALLQAATREYPLDSLHYTSTGAKLLDAMAATPDAELVDHVARQYSTLNASSDKFRYDLLNLLARQHSSHAYKTIEKLLRQGLPAAGDPSYFVQNMNDGSLQLVRSMHPYLLTLSGDSILGVPLFHLHLAMLDSNFISIDDLKPYQHLIFKAVKNELAKATADKEPYYSSMGWYSLLGTLERLNTDTAKLSLQRFARLRQGNIKTAAALSLLRLNEPVDAAIIEAIAADKDYRGYFYDELKDLKREKLFPAKYLNQKSFAETYIYNSDDDEKPSTLQFIGERTATFNGKKQRFYLYKTVYEYEDRQYAYLAVGGCFDTDPKKFESSYDISGIYWEEEFSQSAIDKHFKAYLAAYEEAVKNTKEEE
ncbi:MAG TPA: TraB/GumN family protein [Chitinophagaceae bacterium]|nr:TraB/GumN family protein [Chitinophagaceae bacterium]